MNNKNIMKCSIIIIAVVMGIIAIIGVFEGWQRGALLLLNLVLPPVNF